MSTYTPQELIDEIREPMEGNDGKGSPMGTLTATNDPAQQHLIGVPQFLHYAPDDQLIVTIWSRFDYPEQWDALMKVWTHHDDDRLVEIERMEIEQVLADRTEED